MIMSTVLFVFLIGISFFVKSMQKNDVSGKCKRFNELVEIALIVQFLIIVNDIFSIF